MDLQPQHNEEERIEAERLRNLAIIHPVVVDSLKGSVPHLIGVCASFAASVATTAWGLATMHLDVERKAYLAMGFTFMTASTFTLSKTLHDLHEAECIKRLVDTGVIKMEGGDGLGETLLSAIGGSSGWLLHAWLGFTASIVLTGWGIMNLPIVQERKIFLATSSVLLLSSTMSLVKVVRDRLDARRWTLMLAPKVESNQDKGKDKEDELEMTQEADRTTTPHVSL